MSSRLRVIVALGMASLFLIVYLFARSGVEIEPGRASQLTKNSRVKPRVKVPAYAAERESIGEARSPVSDASVSAAARPLEWEEGQKREQVLAWLRENAAVAEKNVDYFCLENRRLAQLAIVPRETRKREAAYYLAIRMDWNTGPSGLNQLPEALDTRLRSLGKGGWLKLQPEDWRGLDFEWMKELLSYDHWSLSADGPLRQVDSLDPEDHPWPNFSRLQLWSKLRLAKGLRENDLASATTEVHHLAQLIQSTGTQMGQVVAGTLLRLEAMAWEEYAANAGPNAVTSTEKGGRISEADYDLYTRLVRSTPYFQAPGVPAQVRQKALECSIFRCAAITESAASDSAIAGILPAAANSAPLADDNECDTRLIGLMRTARPASTAYLALTYGQAFGAKAILPSGYDAN